MQQKTTEKIVKDLSPEVDETKLRSILQIQKFELKKILPLCIMAIMITYIYNTLRATKDAMVIPLIGAEVVSSLKLWAVLPFAVIFLLIYSKLTNSFSKQKVFYIISSFFVIFFLSFAFIIYPIHEHLHPDLSAQIEQMPHFKWPLLMISNWTFSLFYVMAELCGNVTIFILFWQLVNEINTVKEAKRFYALFILISHIGHVLAGITSKTISANPKYPDNLIASWDYNIKILMIFVACALFILISCYSWIQSQVITDPRLYKPRKKAQKEEKVKLTLMQSIKFIMSSKYIGLIAAMILCYGVSINIVEGVWKSQVKLQYPTSSEYSGFMGTFQIFAGSFNIIIALIGAKMIRSTSWLVCALITPITILFTGLLFFALITFRENLQHLVIFFSVSVVFAAVFIGAVQNIISKAVKYSIFDMTKEMAYIPLSEELKTKGKAAADLIGHKLGKSGGAFIQWALLSLIPDSNLMSLTNYFFVIFTLMMLLWIWSVVSLNKEFLEKVQQYEQEQEN